MNSDGNVFDAGNFGRGKVDFVDLEASVFGPAQIHAIHHLGPVLCIDAAGAGLDREDGVAVIVLAAEHQLELSLCQRTVQCIDLLRGVGHSRIVLRLLSEFEHHRRVVGAVYKLSVGVDACLQRGHFTHQHLRSLGVVPEIRFSRQCFDLGDAFFFDRQVKDAPAERRCGCALRRV